MTPASPVECPAHRGQPLVHQFELQGWTAGRCAGCGLYVLFRTDTPRTALDRLQFEGAFENLRHANYRHILERVGGLRALRGSRLLDVGCSNGWFLSQAAAAGCEAYGIEPDEFFYRRAAAGGAGGARVVHGYFPNDLPSDWPHFDVISFHDVFEHLPEPLQVLAAVRQRLVAGGLLILSLPMADGFVFRLASALYRFGFAGPLERMFQVHYPFPHLFYFSQRSITALAQHAGFALLHIEPLRSFSMRGSLNRARMDQSTSVAGRLKQYVGAAALCCFALLEPLLPADNCLVILRSPSA